MKAPVTKRLLYTRVLSIGIPATAALFLIGLIRGAADGIGRWAFGMSAVVLLSNGMTLIRIAMMSGEALANPQPKKPFRFTRNPYRIAGAVALLVLTLLSLVAFIFYARNSK